MKVLLLGEFSSLHLNIAQGLKCLGIDVTTASNGDFWKNIPRDIDLKKPEKFGNISFPIKLIRNCKKLTGYDVVQLIEANFLMSKPKLSNIYFEFLKRFNGKFFMCASGMDFQYVTYALTGQLKYSVFNISGTEKDSFIQDLKKIPTNKDLEILNTKVANYCNGIIATSNGYFTAYKKILPLKTHFAPLAIDTDKYNYISSISTNTKKIRFFLGLMNKRRVLKGTDRIKNNLQALRSKYPMDIDLTIVDSVPFNEYTKLLNSSHVLCDQLYAYGIGMNGLIAQSKGLIVGGGADKEMYNLLGEYNNRPILDLNTSDKQMIETFESLIDNKSNLKELSYDSRRFVIDNYNYIKVAKKYLAIWQNN